APGPRRHHVEHGADDEDRDRRQQDRQAQRTQPDHEAPSQLALRTSSMNASVLVSTHCGDTASTPIVPMRSPLAVTTLPLVGEGFTLRCTRIPRRGSYLKISAEARAVSGLLTA